MPPTPPRALVTLAAAALAGTAALAVPLTASATSSHPAALSIKLPATLPTWARTARVLGLTPANETVLINFALVGKDPEGETAYGTAATTPGNPLYRHWLTKDQFEARFGAQPGAAEAVIKALKALGVTNVMTDKMGLGVLASMPASVAASIFQVTFHQLQHGHLSLRVPNVEPTMPASLRPYVQVMSGLTEAPLHLNHTTLTPVAPSAVTVPTDPVPTAYFNAHPASTYFGSDLATNKPTYKKLAADTSTTKPYVTSGYTPPQLRGAYGVTKVKQTGKGVLTGVALFYSGPKVGADLKTFSTAFHLAAPTYTDLSVENQGIDYAAGGAPVLTPNDAAGEQTLDVEAIHQMAPDAAIDYSGAVAPEDPAIYVALDTLLAAGVEVINNSYGGTGDTDSSNAAEFHTLVTGPAMTMGIGLDYSSGDAADDTLGEGQREVDFPSSSSEVTAVGGTLLKVGKANDYEGEAYWGTYSTPALGTATKWGTIASQVGGAGGGGGVSTAYAEPSWQKGIVPTEETTNKDTGTTQAGRVTPDVSMLADSTTGILVGETQQSDVTAAGAYPNVTGAFSYYRIGGTSVSSPLFTGMMALVDQALGKSAGFINPTVYPFLSKFKGSFRDPQLGRTATGKRLGSTAKQLNTGCTGSSANSDLSCVGSGPGAVPILSEVRSDYTDTANNGIATVTYTDPTGGLAPVVGTAAAGNKVVYHLRGQGVLGTLEDLPGFDDSTGLGSPFAPAFIDAFLGKKYTATTVKTTTPTKPTKPTGAGGGTSTPTAPTGSLPTTGGNPAIPGVALAALVVSGGAVLLRRRLR